MAVPIAAPRSELTTESTSEFQIDRWNVGFVKTLAIHSKLSRSTPPTLPSSRATTGISSNIAQKIRNGANARSNPTRLTDRPESVTRRTSGLECGTRSSPRRRRARDPTRRRMASGADLDDPVRRQLGDGLGSRLPVGDRLHRGVSRARWELRRDVGREDDAGDERPGVLLRLHDLDLVREDELAEQLGGVGMRRVLVDDVAVGSLSRSVFRDDDLDRHGR